MKTNRISTAKSHNTAGSVVLAVLCVLSVAGAFCALTLPEGAVSSLVGFLAALVAFSTVVVLNRYAGSSTVLCPMWVWVLGAVALGYGIGGALAKGPKFDAVFLAGFLVGGLVTGISRFVISRGDRR